MHKWVIVIISILILGFFLRSYQIERIPPALYWEEVALGYDAYSILKTGKDHHGTWLPLVAFESFGDWKPSLYFYALVPSVGIWGLTPWAVRFPSMLLGSTTVGLVGLVAWELGRRLSQSASQWSLVGLSMFFLAIMPWHILISRVGFEANLGLFLVVLASWLGLKAVRSLGRGRKRGTLWLGLSLVGFGLSLYAYHGNRLFVPLLGCAWGVWYGPRLWRTRVGKLSLLGGMVLVTLFLLPLLLNARNPVVAQRFAQTSAFTALEPILASNTAITQDRQETVARVLHHRWLYYADIFWKNYLSHFDSPFLLLSGDENPRHSVGLVGQLYWVIGGLVGVGLWGVIRNRQWQLVPLLIWLVLAPIPASITVAAPHALRSLPMVVPLSIFSAYGAWVVWQGSQKRWGRLWAVGLMSLLSVGLILELGRFTHYYWVFYSTKTQREWQYGYEELMTYVASVKEDYDQIVITRSYGRPAMYYWFVTQADPTKVQQWNQLGDKDQGEYLQYEQLYFGSVPTTAATLEITQQPRPGVPLIQVVHDLSGKPVFYAYPTAKP